jgi:hypothetical protein
MQELCEKLDIKSLLSMAFYPQMDGETKHVNLEIEQFFCVFCNSQQDNWVDLFPFAKFTHNIQAYSIMG